MDIQTVIKSNRALLQKARDMNIRCGENVFPVPSRSQLEEALKAILAGARSVREIGDLRVLALPELDPEMVELVLGENPDEITVLGRSLRVEYRVGYAPCVTLDQETASAHRWRELPDDGVRLPGGRLVEVVVPFGYYDTVAGSAIPELKVLCAIRANKSLWESWTDRPSVQLPDPADPESVMPDIIECQYGTSVVDGAPLLAWGTVAVKSYRYYGSDPWFEAKWYQSREEATRERAEAATKLESFREEAIGKKQIADAREAAEAVRERARVVQSHNDWYELEAEIHNRLGDRLYACLPSTLEDLQKWTEETTALLAEAEQALEEGTRVRKAAWEAEHAAEEADRVRLSVLLEREWNAPSLEQAREVEQFVTDCIAKRGAKKALEILDRERYEAYGRARRTASLEREFQGVDHRGLDWAAGRDIELAREWCENVVATEPPPAKVASTKPAPEAPPASTEQVTNAMAALKARFNRR